MAVELLETLGLETRIANAVVDQLVVHEGLDIFVRFDEGIRVHELQEVFGRIGFEVCEPVMEGIHSVLILGLFGEGLQGLVRFF